MIGDILAEVRRVLQGEHPVMAAMAMKLGALEAKGSTVPSAQVLLVFDGPALPERQLFEFLVPLDGYQPVVSAALRECEVQIANAMKKSGLGV